MAKQIRTHKEWFMSSCYGKCDCGSGSRKARLQAGVDTTVYIWGEYQVGKWRSIQRVCQLCFQREVVPRLVSHASGCGCTFLLQARSGHQLAPWIRLPDNFNAQCAA